MVDCYITATEFGRQKYIRSGIPAEKIFVKPNFVHSDCKKQNNDKGYALYVGRLSHEKGVSLLLEAWQTGLDIPLKIMGDGPLSAELRTYVQTKNIKHVEFLGYQSKKQYDDYMNGAKFIVVPSVCYENFPRIIAEAYAYGIPVLASRLGTMEELVKDNVTGLLFTPGDSHDLAGKVRWLSDHRLEWQVMCTNVSQEYEQRYTAERNYNILMNIYKKALESKQKN